MFRAFESSLVKKRATKTQDGIPLDKEKEWKQLEKEMRDALRLRQRSLSTEKTYLLVFCSIQLR